VEARTRTGPASPYEQVLGAAFATLDPSVQRAHLPPLVATGSLDVQHGSHALTPLLISILKLPAAGRAQPVRLEVIAAGMATVWMRRIGGTVLRTVQHARSRRIVEHHGIARVEFELQVDGGSLEYRQAAMRIGRLPVPAFIRPRVRARVSAAPPGWHVAVVVSWRDHLVCRYSGVMSIA
jgi:Domain of unknown function (DUF4166)